MAVTSSGGHSLESRLMQLLVIQTMAGQQSTAARASTPVTRMIACFLSTTVLMGLLRVAIRLPVLICSHQLHALSCSLSTQMLLTLQVRI